MGWQPSIRLNLLFVGLTVILAGYLMVWLPGPSAGLQLIGIEVGEWIKFLGIGAGRNWFYLPPIVIGLTLALLAATWPNGRIQTWMARGLAIAAAMLAIPALAAIQLEPPSEWLARLLAIALVGVVALAGAIPAQRWRDSDWIWLLVVAVALAGAIVPTVQYLIVRPAAEASLLRPVGVGVGVWLNAIGSLLVAAVALAEISRKRQTKKTAVG